jgi:biopolymer transport protein ExbB/TolQ
MLSFDKNNFLVRPEDIIWDVPVVLFCVWTVVLVVASLIVISCLRRETKKFHKRLSKADNKEDLVRDIAKLDSIMASYVQQFLGQGSWRN